MNKCDVFIAERGNHTCLYDTSLWEGNKHTPAYCYDILVLYIVFRVTTILTKKTKLNEILLEMYLTLTMQIRGLLVMCWFSSDGL